MLVLDERHQVHVVLAPDDEDALAGVKVAALDVEDDVLEPDVALRPELRVLRVRSILPETPEQHDVPRRPRPRERQRPAVGCPSEILDHVIVFREPREVVRRRPVEPLRPDS